MEQNVQEFLNFIDESTTPFHTVNACEKRLEGSGFEKLLMDDPWQLKQKGKYYVKPYESLLVAFTVGNEIDSLRLVASHTDSPCFKVKTNPELTTENYLKLNTEVYGGPIYSTWLDRLLSIAGMVVLKSGDVMHPTLRFVDFKRPILTIPNIAIHFNRSVNDGVALNPQVDMIPVLNVLEEEIKKDNYLMKLLANELKVDMSEILDFDLYVYSAEKGSVLGVEENMISAPRLDNLASVYASLDALMKVNPEKGLSMAVFYNHEEVGSVTLQGADNSLVSLIAERILMSYGKSREDFLRMLSDSFAISSDAAHAFHPNAADRNDPTNRVLLNRGVAIKYSSKKKYTTDAQTASVFLQLCEKAGVKVQRFAGRSDQQGGMTLGPMMGQYLPIRTVDIGVPMLAMHSSRELIGTKDFLDTLKIFEAFFLG